MPFRPQHGLTHQRTGEVKEKKNLCRLWQRLFFLLDDLESYSERVFVFVPIGAEHLETAYLSRRADVLAYAGTDVVVANADQSDGV